MRQIKYIGLVLVAVLMALTLLIGCAPGPAEELPPIKIGILAPFSGMGEYHSGLLENGARAKLDEVGWEIAGRDIELIAEDTAGDPVIGVDKAKKLVEVDKVDVVIGPLFSHVAMAVASYLTPSRTPLIFYSLHPMEATRLGGGNVFMPVGTNGGSTAYLGSYVYDKLGYRTATLIFDDYVAGEAYTQGFIESFEGSGGTIVQIQRSPLGTFDYAPYIATMEEADVVALWFIPPEMPAFYKQYTEYGKKMPILYTYIALVEQDMVQMGDLSIGTLGQGIYTSLIDTAANKRFVKDMEQKYGWTPSYYEYGSYVSTSLFLEAVKATKSDTTSEAIIQALKQIEVDTPGGKLSFTDEGIGIGDQFILEVVKRGDRYMLEVLETYSQVVMKAPWE